LASFCAAPAGIQQSARAGPGRLGRHHCRKSLVYPLDQRAGRDHLHGWPESNGGPPHQGWLRLNGNSLAAGATFTQEDINQGRLTYQHDDSDATSDDFQFDVATPDGGVIPGPPYMTYSFLIQITLINHAPVANSASGSTSYAVPFNGSFTASDRDLPAQALAYRIITNGAKGTAVITDTNTGAFSYTPNAGERVWTPLCSW